MIKKFISIILIVLIALSLVTLTSCEKSDDNAEIQLWYYDYGDTFNYSIDVDKLIKEIEKFCEKNKIPLKIVKYDEKALTHKDYIFKRNIAAASGNMIIIEDANHLWDLSNHHADYSKLKNYNKLLDEYKDKFCIPIGIMNAYTVINSEILDYYGLKPNDSIITYDNYLELKQQMKEKGAKFELTWSEINETKYYFRNKNALIYLNDNSENLNDINNLKTALKSTLTGICDDFIIYNDGNKLDIDNINKLSNSNQFIHDKNSGLNLYIDPSFKVLTAYDLFEEYYESIINNVLVVVPASTGLDSPCFFMHEKITNKKIYDLANFIISEDIYSTIGRRYSPTFNGKITKRVLELDENLKYNGEYKFLAEQGQEKYINICNLIDDVFDMFIHNKENRNLLTKYYFTKRSYEFQIGNFLMEKIIKLSENNFDYKNEEINKMIDKDIDEFAKNFIIKN